MKIKFLGIALFLIYCGIIPGEKTGYVPGKSYYGKMNFTEYIAGNIPIVISVPHDGNLKPELIPDRKSGATGRDYGTMEIALRIRDRIVEQTGKTPHLVIMHLSRKKLDANRDADEAAQGNSVALEAWEEYHGFIETAIIESEKEYGAVLYVDLHGHKHAKERIEIGYCLDADLLSVDDEMLNDEIITERSSLRKLVDMLNISHSDLIRGERSLGAIFDKYAIKSTPAPSDIYPDAGNYFSGGYTTMRHTVMNERNAAGFQLELNRDIRGEGQNARTGDLLADVIVEYYENYFGKTVNIKKN